MNSKNLTSTIKISALANPLIDKTIGVALQCIVIDRHTGTPVQLSPALPLVKLELVMGDPGPTTTCTEILRDRLLRRCYFVCVAWQNKIVIHGGLPTNKQNGLPLNSLALYDIDTNAVSLLDKSGPSLSHHSGCVQGNILLLVGGWDGRHRSHLVHAFNLEDGTWINMEHLEDKSRPPTGLSGHTATLINPNLLCVLGREGGIKIQRKFGDVFLLHLNLERKVYWYSEGPVKTKSRSGHTAVLAPSLRYGGDLYGLFVFGGRDDETIHKCGQWPAKEVNIKQEDHQELYRHIVEVTRGLDPGQPLGLRYHTMAIVNAKCVIIHGGEHFQSRSNLSGDTLICLNRDQESHWYKLHGSGSACRAGHGMVVLGSQVYLLGGLVQEGRAGRRVSDGVAKLCFSN